MCKSCWLPNLLEEKQNQNTAIVPYYINHLQQELDKNTTLVSVTLFLSQSLHADWISSTGGLLLVST